MDASVLVCLSCPPVSPWCASSFGPPQPPCVGSVGQSTLCPAGWLVVCDAAKRWGGCPSGCTHPPPPLPPPTSGGHPLGASSCPLGHGWWPHKGTSLTPVLLAPTGSEATAAARVRKPAEARTGPCGSEDTDGRDYATESGATRSPGESRAKGLAQTWVATGARCPLVTEGLSLWACLVKLKMVGKCPNPV